MSTARHRLGFGSATSETGRCTLIAQSSGASGSDFGHGGKA
jgi:hypothetical protein